MQQADINLADFGTADFLKTVSLLKLQTSLMVRSFLAEFLESSLLTMDRLDWKETISHQSGIHLFGVELVHPGVGMPVVG